MSFQTERTAVLLATCNGEKYLSQQLDSLLSQTDTDWELFVHDDGSTDATPAILQTYAAAHPDRIRLIEAAPCGSAKRNFFFLMRQVDAPYYLFCDQDDVWNDDKLECSLSALRAMEKEHGEDVPLLVFTDAAVTDGALRVKNESFFSYQRLDPRRLRFSELMVQNVVSGNASVFNRALVQSVRRCSDENAVIMHDAWCALIAAYFGKIAVLEKSTLLYRQHDGNAVGAKNPVHPKYILSVIKNTNAVRAAIRATRIQAGAFAESYGLGADSLPALYAAVGEKSKLLRLRFYRKYGIRKSGFLRTAGFLFFG